MASLAALNSCCPPSQFCGGAWKRWETSERWKASRRDERVTHVGGAHVGARGGAGAGRGGANAYPAVRDHIFVLRARRARSGGSHAHAYAWVDVRIHIDAWRFLYSRSTAAPKRHRSREKVSARPRRHLDCRRDLNETSWKTNTAFPETGSLNRQFSSHAVVDAETDNPRRRLRGFLPPRTSLNPRFRSDGRSETTRTSDGASIDRGV